MSAALAEIFNRSAAAMHEAWPEKLERLVVLVTSSEEPIYVSPAIAEHLTNNAVAVREAVHGRRLDLQRRGILGVVHERYLLAGEIVQLIGMNAQPPGIYSARYTQKMLSIAIFDHEMGHLVVKGGYAHSALFAHRAECAADAYAALRHIQRFGMETDFFEHYNKAKLIVLGISAIHYTDAVVQQVKRLAETENLSSLSLRETAALAAKIASQCYIPDPILKKISAAFAPVQQAGIRQIGSKAAVSEESRQENVDAWLLFCRETLAVIKEHRDDPDIFRAGKRFLSHPVSKKFMAEWAQTDPFWKEALDFMGQHNPENAQAVRPAFESVRRFFRLMRL